MSRPLLAFLFLFPFSLHSSDLADRVQETYRRAKEVRADFVQRTKVDLLDRVITEKGHLFLAKGGRFSVRYEGENAREFISDGKKLKVIHRKTGERETYDVGDLLSREALAFLGGLGEMREQFFVSQPGSDRLALVPRDHRSPFSKVILRINPNSLVEGVVLFPKSGNRSEYTFSDVVIR